MPRRNDLHKIMIVGSGPIIIGQACEFDYSGAQACKALRSDGYEVILINSNPATIMTDPNLADRTYVEPLSVEYAEEIIRKERPDALLSTVGGQTGLNLAVSLAEAGVLDKYNVELIGAKLPSIKKAEDRLLFKDAMQKIGLDLPESQLINWDGQTREHKQAAFDAGLDFAERHNYPIILRPSFTLGGTGGGIAYNREDLIEILEKGLDLSPVHEVLIEESMLGWKEYEMEVMRDLADNCIIVCSIENFDPMGVHTGDSITVAPAQTLTDREYQMMRDASLACLREIGVDTGGSNVQFAIDPKSGRMIIIEMNPRVSRSSALASKATGFPIAKIAAKLAVGYRLDELKNDITLKTPACFEPSIDYVVAKIPRWQFEKFPGAEPVLGTQMKSVGEVMSIGRTFKQALGKAMRSLETGKSDGATVYQEELIKARLITPNPDRLNYIRFAFERGFTEEQVNQLTNIDPWFLRQVREMVDEEKTFAGLTLGSTTRDQFLEAKRNGMADAKMARAWNVNPLDVRARRKELGVKAVYNRVDTCAAEFESFTPYMYSSYESSCEANPTDRKKVIILGSGPNRIGQGIEFDYCCCHASFALREFGVESIMVNCNPETVSTDYDTSDRLYFEPLTLEEVLNICDVEKPDGVIVQFGGQTPLTLAIPLKKRRCADHRDGSREHRFGGGPQTVRQAARRLENSIACERLSDYRRRRMRNRALHRIPGARAPQLRVGRPSHGDRIRRRQRSPLHARSRHVLARPARVDRSIPRRRHRSRRRRIGRHGRQRPDRGHHGTHRRGRRSFRRFQLCASRDDAFERNSRDHQDLHRDVGPRPEGHRSDEHSVRRQGRKSLRHRSEPASLAYGAVRQQGHGRAIAEIAVGLMLGKKISDFTSATGVLPVPQFFVKSPVFPFAKFPASILRWVRKCVRRARSWESETTSAKRSPRRS